ncbi:MAG TPA: porin, partial [Allosphingosinicella sp.]|nr:porin [Allosphingosinicella sp.]
MFDLPPPDPGLEIVFATRGVSKGLVQTEGPQLVVRPEVAFGPVYVGGYAKNVSSPTSDGEGGPVIGFRTSAGRFNLAASATWKFAIAPVGAVDDQALELAGSASRRFGPVTARLSVVWSPNDLGSTTHTTFTEGTLSYGPVRPVTISAAFGVRERGGGPDYRAFNAGASYAINPNVTADLRYYDTDR